MKIISNKTYEEYKSNKKLVDILNNTNSTLRKSLDNAKKDVKKYKELGEKLVDENTDLKLDLDDLKYENNLYKEQVEYLQNELKKYKPEKKKAGRPKKATTEDKPKRKVGRPRKESK